MNDSPIIFARRGLSYDPESFGYDVASWNMRARYLFGLLRESALRVIRNVPSPEYSTDVALIMDKIKVYQSTMPLDEEYDGNFWSAMCDGHHIGIMIRQPADLIPDGRWYDVTDDSIRSVTDFASQVQYRIIKNTSDGPMYVDTDNAGDAIGDWKPFLEEHTAQEKRNGLNVYENPYWILDTREILV